MKQLLKRLSIVKDLGLLNMFRLRFQGITKGRVIIYKKTSVQFEKSSRIHVNGVFMINRKWSDNDPFPTHLALRENSKIIVTHSFSIFSGSRINVNENATLILGSGIINNNLSLSCFDKIIIGDDVAIAENACIRDSDNHEILDGKHVKTAPIVIGNHVWVGMNVTILKGVSIGEGAVVAANSLVNKDVPPKCLVGGVPAKLIKENVEWKL